MAILAACSAPAGQRPASAQAPAPTTTRGPASPSASARASAAAPATLPDDILFLTSDLGDVVGGGVITSLEYPDASFAIAPGSTPDRLRLTVRAPDEDWALTFAPPLGQQLEVGSYDTAERVPSSFVAGLDVRGDRRGCSLGFGSFTIGAIAFDPGGSLSTLDAAFDQACEYPDAPALHGTITYRAPVPGA